MTITQVIDKLQEIRNAFGDLPVVAEDGMDPSDLVEVKRVEAVKDTFFPAKGAPTKTLCVRLS